MKIYSIKVLSLTILLSITIASSFAQGSKSNWLRIPGFTPELPTTLTSQETFFVVIGTAALSYTFAELIFKDEENQNFYQVRGGMNNEYYWGFRKVYHQNFGVENRVKPWFALGLEGNLQQWSDQTPMVENRKSAGMGLGIMSYYRWYAFGKKRISPYLEYGAGLFYGFSKFPYNGTHFTFNLSTQLGLEYTFENKNKLRIAYGGFHQSNNGLVQPNPGYDGDGFSISYSWFWRTSKW